MIKILNFNTLTKRILFRIDKKFFIGYFEFTKKLFFLFKKSIKFYLNIFFFLMFLSRNLLSAKISLNTLIINLSTSIKVFRNINIIIQNLSVNLQNHIFISFNMKLPVFMKVSFLYFLLPFSALAQQTPPPPGGAPPGFALPAILALGLAAVGYGVYKNLNNPKK